MELLLEQLCRNLEDEVQRQESILAVCRAQGEAVRSNNIENLESQTQRVVSLLQEAAEAEKDRNRLVGRLATQCGCPLATLSDLVAVAAGPCGEHLRHIQKRLRSVLAETRKVVHGNTVLFRGGLRLVSQTVRSLQSAEVSAQDSLHGITPESASYTASGTAATRRLPRPAMIDQRG